MHAPYDAGMIHAQDSIDTRHLPLQGAPNFRDMGGYPAADGGTIRRGLLYRSGALAGLTGTDVDTLNTVGLSAIIDLRNEAERLAAPTPATLAASSRMHSLPIGAGEGATPVPRPALLTVADATAEQAVAAIKDSYRRFTR
jgi:protein-tyrosine phosphatase